MLSRQLVFVAATLVASVSATHVHEPLLARDFHFGILKRDGGNPVAVVQDANNYCTFLPSSPGISISDGETDAQPFCIGNPQGGSDTKPMPSNFVLSSHFVQTDSYVQVTGCVDPTKYGLNPVTDGGGQYDNAGSPPAASCAGYNAFVNLVEPTNARFCIRCCQSQDDCNVSISTYGCDRIVPGDYTANNGQDCMTAFNAARQNDAATSASASASASASPSASSNSSFIVNSNSTSNSTTSSNSTVSTSSSASASASASSTPTSGAGLVSISILSIISALAVAMTGF